MQYAQELEYNSAHQKNKSEMSSRAKISKNVMPAEELLHVSSEDDLLRPGDGKSKTGQKISLRSVKAKPKKPEVPDEEIDASNYSSNDVIVSRMIKLIDSLNQCLA